MDHNNETWIWPLNQNYWDKSHVRLQLHYPQWLTWHSGLPKFKLDTGPIKACPEFEYQFKIYNFWAIIMKFCKMTSKRVIFALNAMKLHNYVHPNTAPSKIHFYTIPELDGGLSSNIRGHLSRYLANFVSLI